MKTIALASFIALSLVCSARSGVCEPASSGLVVASATYGVGDLRIDVTGAVRSLIAHDSILLQAPWALGTTDPAPNQIKDVHIVYRVDGAESTATFTQNQHIILPPRAKGFFIVRATFGEGDRRVDVTQDLRSRAAGDKLEIPSGWFLGEVDPAHGNVKDVQIIYLLDGVLMTATFAETQGILLPNRNTDRLP